jgi:zinc finger SWIM domain-containing protein 3
VADDSGIAPKVAHEFLGRYVGGASNLGYTHRDYKNYLRTKRQREMMYGEAGSLLKYFQDKSLENPSFQYATQMDCQEQITNIFWADAKMIVDYAHFGDVITFDTTFGTNKEYRPFGVFVGFNQFRETVVFGGALMYDETFESFKWLFNAFLSIHNKKQPQTIFTDQDSAMGKAVSHVFTSTWHGLCTWHISQNALKHLCSRNEKDSETEEEEGEGEGEDEGGRGGGGGEEESSTLLDFSACMYQYEKKTEFEEAFDAMRGKVSKSTWLDSIYMLKHKWAECYMLDVFSIGMRSTQLSESLNNALKKHLKSDLDIVRFLRRVEQVVEDKRERELQAEFESIKKQPRILMMAPILVQTSKIYTPAIFQAFQAEYEKSLAAYIIDSNGSTEFSIAIGALGESSRPEEERIIIINLADQTVTCSCKLFQRIGILCRHALKGLDLMNIKLLPERYILKRWTRGARSQTIQDMHGKKIVENPKLATTIRYKNLCQIFFPLASRDADFEDCCLLVEEALHNVSKQVKEKIREAPKIDIENSNMQAPFSLPANVAGLKKK